MNIKQLKEIIKDKPDQMDVFVGERKTEFTYGLVNSAYVKEIAFVESPGDEILTTDNVLILDEE
jgi:hypothetical protein